MTAKYTIQASTPLETQGAICRWLRDQAVQYSSQARIARLKKLKHELEVKSTAYAFAASFISEVVIEPSSTVTSYSLKD